MTVVNPRLRNMSASCGLSVAADFHCAMVHLGSVKWTWAFQKPAVTTQWSQGTTGGVGRDCNLLADCRDQAVADQDGSVVDGRIGGRNVDAGVFNGQRALGQLQRRVRPVAGIDLHEPDSGAGNAQNHKNSDKKTKQPSDACITSPVQRSYAITQACSSRHMRGLTPPSHSNSFGSRGERV